MFSSRSDYDKIPLKNKVSFNTFNDPSVTSKTINNSFSMSEVDNSECNSIVSSYRPVERPCDKYGFFIESDDDEYESKA